MLSRCACSRPTASRRLGLVSGPLARPCARPRSGPSALLATAPRFCLVTFALGAWPGRCLAFGSVGVRRVPPAHNAPPSRTKPAALRRLGFSPRFGPSSPMRLRSRFCLVTLRLLTTHGFPPSRPGLRPACAALRSASLRSIRAARDGSALLPCHVRVGRMAGSLSRLWLGRR